MPEEAGWPVVGIGASAGGVEALQALFRAMPDNAPMALVVITHLGPGRESELPGIIARCTSMPVVPVRDGDVPGRSQVHVLSTDAIVTMAEGRLRLRQQDALAPRERQPIDVFFASLAQDRGDRAVGIVLSGGGSDGSLGLKAIKERDGLTLAQGTDGTAPRHPGMPASAVATGNVDLLLPVEEMPARLAEFASSLDMLEELALESRHRSEAQRVTAARGTICDILRSQVGHDFSGYKENTFMRRVRRRMQVLRLREPEAYVERLRQDPEEIGALFRDLLINVTSFFRDTAAFESLANRVLPALFEGRGADNAVRIWVPGCSTGEEAYSLAMLAREQLAGQRNAPRVSIFATDIDEAALGIARAGRYPATLLEGVSPERLAQNFNSDGAAYTVAREVRDLCVFSSHSLIRDPPFSRIDLISCRNLLIYLDSEVQDRALPVFHYALRPGGYLFLGISENVTRHDDLFAAEDRAHRIFRRRDSSNPATLRVPSTAPGGHLWAGPRPAKPGRSDGGPALRGSVEAMVLDEFAPAHVVVDREGDVVLQSGRLGKYLEPAAGTPNRQLLGMARRGLRLELRAALREAMETRRRVQRPRIDVEVDDRVQRIELTVAPLPDRDNAEPLFLVIFADCGAPVAGGRDGLAISGAGDTPSDASVAHLERELRETRERLQSTVEEYETAVEELRSANEEMVSVNEELQSTNEELETAKEEQQSVNEELHTVNLELAAKVEALDRANADLHNLFESTRIATVFLDRHLLIRSFTPAVAEVFNLIPTDRGRPLTDFANHLDGIDLRAEVHAVLNSREPMERRVTSHGAARQFLMRLLPYRTADGLVDGVLVTFIDVSAVVESEARLRNLVDELNHRVRNMLQVVTAVARHTLREAPEPAEFVRSFGGRLQALGQAHALVARAGWGDVLLHDMLEKELGPYASTPGRVVIEGPMVQLQPKVALALGMVLHELTTNAAKHGALSAAEGRLTVSWAVEADGRGRELALRWQEEGGPEVRAPARRGFGSELIHRQLRHDLNGEIEIDYAAAGARARITLPLDGEAASSVRPSHDAADSEPAGTDPADPREAQR